MIDVDLLAAGGKYPEAEKRLNAGLGTLADTDRPLARQRLVELLLAQNKTDEARLLLTELVKSDPKNMRSQRMLIELALNAGDLKDSEHWIQQLRDSEGPNGTDWRLLQGLILVRRAAESRDGNTAAADLNEAQRLQEEIEHMRPDWIPWLSSEGQVVSSLSEGRRCPSHRSIFESITAGRKKSAGH